MLTHLSLDKMAAILAENIFKWILLTGYGRIPIQISLKFVPKSPIDNKSALVQVMARHQAITLTNENQVHRRIHAALGGDELMTP